MTGAGRATPARPAAAAVELPGVAAAVELPRAYRLLNHGPTVLVSSAHAGRINVMAAAWNMALDYTPAKVCVVIDKTTLTRTLVEASGEFVLNVPARSQAAAVLASGQRSGAALPDGVPDKFALLGLGAEPSAAVAAPRVAGCLGWLECRVIDEPRNQQVYDLFIGEVVAAWADPRAFAGGRWLPGAEPSLHYIAGGSFFETGPPLDLAG